MSFAIAEHALGYAVATCGFLIVAEGAGYLTRGSQPMPTLPPKPRPAPGTHIPRVGSHGRQNALAARTARHRPRGNVQELSRCLATRHGRHFALRIPDDEDGVVVAPIVCEVLAMQSAEPEVMNP